MKKFFLIFFLFLFLFTGDLHSQDESKFTFSKQANVLAKEVFPAIKKYLKECDIIPYTKYRGEKVVNDIEGIILSYDGKKLSIAKYPLVELYSVVVGGNTLFNLKVLILVYDGDSDPRTLTTMVFGKYFYINEYNKVKKFNV